MNCKKCGVDDRSPSGNCRPCNREAVKRYQTANPEKVREMNASQYARNPERIAQWLRDNPERAQKKRMEYLEKNRDQLRQKAAAWRVMNPEKARRIAENRRARKFSGGVLSKGISEKLLVLQKGRCPCCGEKLGDDYELDHKIPLAKGGPNSDENMQLLRSKCNRQKGAKHPVDFMQSRGFLL